ncbi:MAG: hypothetical protein COZ76_11235 [Flavobacteriales bacterium CG_4_8_14_3_um_filter_35_10]|nr:MAG: hypothetical protein COZ76_11235 [Flavobacteriales bacterium CG_4_8_14_3_um_filter_35_10]
MKKELERTQNISISAIIFILLIIIGILSFKKPVNVFNKDKNLPITPIEKQDFIINKSALDSLKSDLALVDLRASHEFDRGSLANAINIYTPNLLDKNAKEQLEDFTKRNKIIVLFGSDPNQANGAWLFLTQLGYKNVKILCASLAYDSQNKLIVSDFQLEKPDRDYASFMAKVKPANGTQINIETKKKTIQFTKTKKKKTGGGC